MGDGTGCDNMTAIIVRIGENAGEGTTDETKPSESGVKRAHSPILAEGVPEIETKRARVDGEEEAVAAAVVAE